KEVYLGSEKDVKTRLVMFLFPADIHAERVQEAKNKRNKLNKKKRKENKKIEKENKILIEQGKELKKLKEIKGALTKQEKAKLALGFYITNTEKEDIPAEKVRTVYRLRWQIELVFKAWKQNCEIDKTKKMKVERFITHLYAKLLLVLTNWFIFWEMSKNAWKDKQIVLSIQKTFKRLKAIKEKFTEAIRKTSSKLIKEFIQSIFELQDKCQLEKKKGQLTLKEIMFMFK
ncbi:MAG: transposase, partial [Flavobacteriaceae bacterium]|nr:transposase [Flavobacteriaceae bacterium]